MFYRYHFVDLALVISVLLDYLDGSVFRAIRNFTRYNILTLLHPLAHEPNVTGENVNNDLLKFCDWQNNGSNLDPDFERKRQEDVFPVILNKLFSIILHLWKSLYEKNIGFY